jgi:hypothetical protein
MESYIVRVYRRSDEPGSEVAGLAERVGDGKRQAFSSSGELWRFLAAPLPRLRRVRRAADTKKRQGALSCGPTSGGRGRGA